MATRTEPFTRARVKRRESASALASVDHKTIGVRYMITAFMFFCLAGLEVVFLRAQLFIPENTLLSPDIYNQFFTMHGTTMVFFFAAPVLLGLWSYLVPLMIGARSMAFPRLNAFSYWVFLLSGLFLYASLLVDMVPNGGWFAYDALVSSSYASTLNLDLWSLGLIFLSIAFAAGAVNFIVTIFKMRAPGMSFRRVPLFSWAVLITSFALLIAAFTMAVANILLLLERRLNLHFFQNAVQAGSSPLLSQHLFWVFAFPVLLVVVLPVTGIISEIIGTFGRRPVLGDRLLRMTILAAALVALVVWLAHLAALLAAPLAANFLGMDVAILAIPGGILVFTWLATLLAGRPVWKTPLIWAGGFIFLFTAGGLASLVLAIAPLGSQLAGTTFDVARLHLLLVGGTALPIFAGIYYWFPKIFGRMLSERLGMVQFWLFFIGLMTTFLPLLVLGLMGMPRRIYTYLPGRGWDGLNLVAVIGGVMIAESVLFFIGNVIYSLARGQTAGNNPWEGSSLEWAAASPPEAYNFRTVPEVSGSVPLWTAAGSGSQELETAGERLPVDSLAPLLLAVALLALFIGLLLSQFWLTAAGGVLSILMIVAWVWSSRSELKNT